MHAGNTMFPGTRETGLRETWAALAAEGVHLHQHIMLHPSSLLESWPSGGMLMMLGSWLPGLTGLNTLLTSITRLICQHFTWLLNYPLEYNNYSSLVLLQQKNYEVVNLSSHDPVQNCQKVTRLTVKSRHSTSYALQWIVCPMRFPSELSVLFCGWILEPDQLGLTPHCTTY